MLHRAQEALAHKLGTLPKESTFDEAVYYKRLFDGPLSQEAIAALTSLFKLDYNLTAQMDDTQLNHGGYRLLDACGREEANPREGDAPPSAGASDTSQLAVETT